MNKDCEMAVECCVCGGTLDEFLSLGEQCLGGQFPDHDDPDPPRFPLALCRCTGCGLVQLGHTVRPEFMFRSYGYRSGITASMRMHLCDLAAEATELLAHYPTAVLDIGGNDGTLAEYFGKFATVVDPSDVPCSGKVGKHVHDFYPTAHPDVRGKQFDLIFSIACFYDTDDPVAFASSVCDNLKPAGLWCVEVANWWEMILARLWDGVCHEHLCYYDPVTIREVLKRSELRVVQTSYNKCNGGSMRLYCCREDSTRPPSTERAVIANTDPAAICNNFAADVGTSAKLLRRRLLEYREDGLKVHLLGASTKANTVLQHAGVTPALIQAASDRDVRKHGRRTPGTNIPILSEEESRAQAPDVYVCLLHHFRAEVVARESGFLMGGGRILFPIPHMEEVIHAS